MSARDDLIRDEIYRIVEEAAKASGKVAVVDAATRDIVLAYARQRFEQDESFTDDQVEKITEFTMNMLKLIGRPDGTA